MGNGRAKMNLVTVCVSKYPILNAGIGNFHNYFDNSTVEKRGSFERVKKVAEMRNAAMEGMLQLFPDVTDVMMIDPYYLHQKQAIRKLTDNYRKCKTEHVRGGAIWRWKKIGILRRASYYDSWAVPDEPERTLFKPKAKDQRIVDCVGGVYIFPVSLWMLRHYGVPFPLRTEHYSILKNTDLPIVLDREAQFWRTPEDSEVRYYSWPKRIRVTTGRMRRKILHV